ncbi:MAG: GntR family transcriptional regulator [Armatimonadota bacterium]|nr:GntR family transcriptional regulator [Armatimonadota bacterium]
MNNSLDAYVEIRARILNGTFRPRERLIEERLARELGMSRTPIRQALTRLEAEGLVSLIPNRGAVVCSYTPQDVLEIYDLRALLEGHAARHAANEITPSEVDRLRQLVAEMEGFNLEAFASHEDAVRWFTVRNNEFHHTIHVASRNQRLVKLLNRTIQIPLVYRSFFGYSPREYALSNYYHRKIAQALEQKDGDQAEVLMRAHIYQGRDFVLSMLQDAGV